MERKKESYKGDDSLIDLRTYRCTVSDFSNPGLTNAEGDDESVVEDGSSTDTETEVKCVPEIPEDQRTKAGSSEESTKHAYHNHFSDIEVATICQPSGVYDTIDESRHSTYPPTEQNKSRRWFLWAILGIALVAFLLGIISVSLTTAGQNQADDTGGQALASVLDVNSTFWSDWSACTRSCGLGTRTRSRSCPETADDECPEPTEELEVCMLTACQIGTWSAWSAWGTCSITCGVGVQTRSRECNNLLVSVLGNRCPGSSADARVCYGTGCRSGGWSAWSSWGTCDRTCDGGVRARSRICNNPTPSVIGKMCEGPGVDVSTCNLQACRHGSWFGWGSWSVCSVTCGGGVRYRTRSCSAGSYHGYWCQGAGLSVQGCNNSKCR